MPDSSSATPFPFPLPRLSLRLRPAERKFLLRSMDLLLVNAALITALRLRTNLLPELSLWLTISKWFVTLSVVWLAIATIFDIYNLARAGSSTYSLQSTAATAALSSFIYVWIPWLTPPIQNRTQAFLFILLAILFTTIWRLLYAQLSAQLPFLRRTLIIGTGSSGQALVHALRGSTQEDANPFRGTGHVLLGFIEAEPHTPAPEIQNLPILGNSQQLPSLVRQLSADEIIVAITNPTDIRPELFESILQCREIGVPVINMTTVYERLTGRVAIDHAGYNLELATALADDSFVRLNQFIKRGMDLLGASLSLPFLILLIPIVAVANLLRSPGPLFFYQTRVGKSGRHFVVCKFRSMIPEAEKRKGAIWASQADNRITPIGKLLRQTHLDELPQLFNILRGEMSLVGPRPERPEFVENLVHHIPFYRARHSVLPGLTGWAQIHQDYSDSLAGSKEKLEYDLYYIKHTSPMLDLIIILRTIAKVVGLRGR